MLLDAIKQLNWLDLAMIVIFFYTIHIALKRGLTAEIFKLMGILTVIFFATQYFTKLSDFAIKIFKLQESPAPLQFVDFICFSILAAATYSFFMLLRFIFFQIFKIEAVSRFNKFGGLILGLVRGILLCALLSFTLAISSVDYFRNSVAESYSGIKLFKVYTDTYSLAWQGLMSKFITGEKFNNVVEEVGKGLKQ